MRQHIFSIIAFDDRLVALSDNDISARIENLGNMKTSIEILWKLSKVTV